MFRRLSVLFALVAISITIVPIPESAAAVCDATPGALQSVIDGAADGIGITNPKVKLVDAPAEGYTVVDLSDQCFADQGVVEVGGRYGLWIFGAATTGTSWRVSDSAFITMTGFEALDARLSSVRTDTLRIEDLSIDVLTATDATDLMAGKLTVTGPVTFDGFMRVASDRGFARNSTFETFTISGVVNGFTLDSTELSAPPLSLCDPCESLRFSRLSYPETVNAPEIEPIPDVAASAGVTVVSDLVATDADGDSVAFSLGANTPEFISISTDPDGAHLVIEPSEADAGLYETIVVIADDGLVATAITVTVIVEAGTGTGTGYSTVGYFGCSNTVRAVDGYHAVGGLKMWEGLGEATDHPYGGNDLATSTDFTSEAWGWLTEQLATSSPDVIWWQMCVKHGPAGPEPTEEEIAQAKAVLHQLQSLAPGIPIHVSDLNEYEGVTCSRLGRYGTTSDDLLADLIAAEPGAERGPDMSTLTPETVERDNCHQNPEGQLNDGDLLLSWFG